MPVSTAAAPLAQRRQLLVQTRSPHGGRSHVARMVQGPRAEVGWYCEAEQNWLHGTGEFSGKDEASGQRPRPPLALGAGGSRLASEVLP